MCSCRKFGSHSGPSPESKAHSLRKVLAPAPVIYLYMTNSSLFTAKTVILLYLMILWVCNYVAGYLGNSIPRGTHQGHLVVPS